MSTLTKEALKFEAPLRPIPRLGGIPVEVEIGSTESALLTHIAGLTIHPGVLEIITQSQLPQYRALYRQLRNEAFGLVEWAVRHPDEFTEANRVLILPYFPHIAGKLSEIEKAATPGYNFGNPQAAIYRELKALSRSSGGVAMEIAAAGGIRVTRYWSALNAPPKEIANPLATPFPKSR